MILIIQITPNATYYNTFLVAKGVVQLVFNFLVKWVLEYMCEKR